MIIFYNFILGKREKQQCRIITFRDYYICGYDLNVSVNLNPLRLLSPDHWYSNAYFVSASPLHQYQPILNLL